MKYYIGIDIGTTSTKAVLYDQDANVINKFQQGYRLYRDQDGMAEQDPEEIVQAVLQMIHDAAGLTNEEGNQLTSVSFSCANQSLILLDQDHHPISRVMTWADTRARRQAEALKQSSKAKTIYEKTGTPIHPMSPLIKLMWLKETKPDLIKQASFYADIKSYLFWRLFGQFRIDVSIASCTGLMNLETQNWDPDILAMLHVSVDQLPEIVDSIDQAVGLSPVVAGLMGVDAEVPFVYGAFDGALSNLGVGAIQQDTVAITIGTSAAVRVICDHPVIDPHQRLFCYSVNRHLWVIGGPINNGGDVFQWAVEELIEDQIQAKYDVANRLIDQVPAGAHGLLFHPFLGGERAPIWEANARGSFVGLNPLHTRADMLRAVMEGICFNIATVFEAVQTMVGKPKRITATGGFANSKVWRQMLADVLDCPVNVPKSFESGCLGAVVMAMQSLGELSNLADVTSMVGQVEAYLPDEAVAALYQRYLLVFKQVEEQLLPTYAALVELQEDQK
ncbi:gluconokinase [Limosilactobacillus gastricus]|uniref:gluconokinase n=1 Tax=Limosilactobacillus gastricus TaxID=227942 RepID=UPI0026F18A74|nr:gluconokinase [Limosilactobacillus gastricus]